MTARRLFALLSVLFIGTLVALLGARDGSASRGRSASAPTATAGREVQRDVTNASAALSQDGAAAEEATVLPSFFYGAKEVSGHVVDPAGNPSIGARVNCRPGSFALLAPLEMARFETTTDEQGRFGFSDLPADRGFVITATQDSMFATVVLSRQDATESVKLKLALVAYERYRFLGAHGEAPVPFTPDRLLGSGTDVLWTSVDGRNCPAWILERIGAPRLDATQGEVAIIYGGSIAALRTMPRVFRAGGYEPVVVSTTLRPLSEWPARTDVPVNRLDDGRILYRVVAPTVAGPGVPEAVLSRLAVYLRSEQWSGVHVVTESAPTTFLDMPTVTINIRIDGQEERLNYVTELSADGATVIRPQYPEWAFVQLTYGVVGDRDVRDSAICVTRTGWSHVGVSLYPGVALFGPLPPDAYEFRVLRPIRGVPRVLKAWGPVAVREGLNAFQWPD